MAAVFTGIYLDFNGKAPGRTPTGPANLLGPVHLSINDPPPASWRGSIPSLAISSHLVGAALSRTERQSCGPLKQRGYPHVVPT
jgi:hypothetical protein